MTSSNELQILTDDQKREFCLIVLIGCDRETACNYLGWSRSQLQNALKQDPQFAKRLARAEATPEFIHMRNLHNAAKDEKHWRVSVWWLERCAPERYARRNPDAVSAAQLRQIIKQIADAITGEVASPDDRQRLLTRLSKIAREVQDDQSPETEDRSCDSHSESQPS